MAGAIDSESFRELTSIALGGWVNRLYLTISWPSSVGCGRCIAYHSAGQSPLPDIHAQISRPHHRTGVRQIERFLEFDQIGDWSVYAVSRR
jgi:hypothetical protein